MISLRDNSISLYRLPVSNDNPADDGLSLRGSTGVVVGEPVVEMAERFAISGVEIVEARISHLAYAAEIAQAMLRSEQPASPVVNTGTLYS